VRKEFTVHFETNDFGHWDKNDVIASPGKTPVMWEDLEGQISCAGPPSSTTADTISITVPFSCFDRPKGEVVLRSAKASSVLETDGETTFGPETLGTDELVFTYPGECFTDIFSPIGYSIPDTRKAVSVSKIKVKKRTVTAQVSSDCGQKKYLQEYSSKSKKWTNVKGTNGYGQICSGPAVFKLKAKSKGTYRIVALENEYAKTSVSKKFKIK